MPVLSVEFPLLLGRLAMPLCLFLAMPLRAQEKPIVALQEFVSTEIRQQGFTLPRAMKVHVYARGGGFERPWGGERDLFAFGWILNAATREVVWQMSGANSRREGPYRISDQYLDLPAGSFEVYFSNHAFGRETLFSQGSSNIDRRHLPVQGRPARGFLSLFGADTASRLRLWRERARNYGLMVSLPGPDAAQVQTFAAPLPWKNIFVALAKTGDSGQWDQGFRVKRSVTIHIYALGEGSRARMHDSGWILDAHSRKRVWEMSADKAQYAGGARKNLRQVETLQLPPGDYIASFATDDSHSPADWNAAPPCDPGMYGLTLAIPKDAEASRVVPMEIKGPGPVLAEAIRVKSRENRSVPFTLAASQAVRVHAIGEGRPHRMADFAWIEDARTGQTVWTMEDGNTHHAGGAPRNRMVDARIPLAKGSYILRFRTDGAHAYGDWHGEPPRDTEHYGVSVYAAGE